MIFISHNLHHVYPIADRIVVLKGGEMQEAGTTQEILNDAKHPYTRELLDAFDPAAQLHFVQLRCGDTTVAYHFGFLRDARVPQTYAGFMQEQRRLYRLFEADRPMWRR